MREPNRKGTTTANDVEPTARPAGALLVVVSLLLGVAPSAGAAEPPAKGGTKTATRTVSPLDLITVRPADTKLERIETVNQDGDGEGEELPPSILYFPDKKDFFTTMTVTDRRLCVRKDEKAICRAFEAIVDGRVPKLGAEISSTRIGGSGYVTKFLAIVPGVDYPGLDRVVAFLGSDSQDPPMGNLALYLYARKGTALIQLTTKVGECGGVQKKGESEAAYFHRTCLNDTNVQVAAEKAKGLTATFRLAR